jgi:beta-ribofuranosylaminobenzene 5'-phosphate synthase
MATVEAGARLHFGFQNLSLAHERLYGGVGVALAEPRLTVEAEQSRDVDVDPVVDPYVDAVVEALSVPGARVTVTEQFGRHVGLGSGTQLALATLVAVAEAYGRDVDPRALAPELGRGGRSGVGVGTFEAGGFVIDAGHPTERFTTTPPAQGDWDVPASLVTAGLPEQWRFLLVTPAETAAPSGEEEDASMRAIVERADPGIADEIAGLVTRRILPAVADGDLAEFGTAVARLGRLNGAWYADEQGGVYRPPAGRLVEALADEPAVRGTGQSSWGPTVYGVTHADDERRARDAAERALSEADVDGRVRIVAPRSWGHRLENDRS